MLNILLMKPSHIKFTCNNLRLIFAYQHFSIEKDGETYNFIPIEDKEIRINLHTFSVENLDSVFVFQYGNRYIRLPLRELLMVKNINLYLMPIMKKVLKDFEDLKQKQTKMDEVLCKKTHQTIAQLERDNLLRLINEALDNRNQAEFERLVAMLNEVKVNDI